LSSHDSEGLTFFMPTPHDKHSGGAQQPRANDDHHTKNLAEHTLTCWRSYLYNGRQVSF